MVHRKQNLIPSKPLRLAELGAAFVPENLGDNLQALRLRESGYERGRSAASRADAVRGLWIIAGEAGDYRPFFENGNPAREQILTALADGWRNRADSMEIFGGPIPARLEAAGKAVELSRQLAAADPSTANRLGLAHSLRLQGDAFHAAASCSKGVESSAAYRHSRDSYVKALKVLTALPAAKADIMTLTNNLADTAERLRH